MSNSLAAPDVAMTYVAAGNMTSRDDEARTVIA